MWSSRCVFVLALALSAAACGGAAAPSSKPTTTTTAPPPGDGVALTQAPPPAALPIPTDAAAPADLLARGFVASPTRMMADAAAFANSVMPGMGAQLSPELLVSMIGLALGAPPLPGLDPARPVAIAVLDPQAHAQPLLIAAGVLDRAALDAALDGAPAVHATHFAGGVVVLGADAARAAGAGWLAAQVAAPTTGAPTAPTLTVHLDQVWARYGDRVRATLDGAGQAASLDSLTRGMTTSLIDGLLATRELVVALDLGATNAALTATVRAVPGSGMARFAAAQRPASFELMARVAHGPGAFAGGDLQLDGFIDTLVAMISMQDGISPAQAARYQQAMRAVYQGLNGPMAMRMDMRGGRMAMTMLMGSSRPAATAAAMAEVSSTQAPTVVAATLQRGGFRHKKVRGDVITTRIRPSAPAEVRQTMEAAWGGPTSTSVVVALADALVMTIGQDAAAQMVTQLDAPTRPPSPELADAIAAASGRRSSFLMYLDLLAIMAAQQAAAGAPAAPPPAMPAPMPVEIGFTGTDTWMRVGLSADAFRAVAMLGARP